MTPRNPGSAVRSILILIRLLIYSPWHADPTWTLVARLALTPLVALIGIALWKQGRLTTLFISRPR